MKNRPKVPQVAAAEVLTACLRRCCLCAALRSDTGEKKGQIAHLDHDPSNNAADNLVFLCFEHHDQYDSSPSQSKGLTIEELKQHRAALVSHMARSAPNVLGPSPDKRHLSSRNARAGLALAIAIVGYGLTQWGATRLLHYPVELSYVRQYETQAGYVLHLQIKSTNGTTVFIPSDRFEVKVALDDPALGALSLQQKKGLVYGESAKAFDNKLLLDSAAQGLSYANANASIACVGEARDLFLLVTVAGPGSPNPSARFQLGRIYRSLTVRLRKRLFSPDYLDVPIDHVPIVASDAKTRVIEK
jgi:hypothetical protein